jgi:osmotically-inducible protein OsmY
MNLRISICTMIIGGLVAGSVLADATASPAVASSAVASSVSDKDTISRVRTALAGHPNLGVQYSVSTRRGVVYLDGMFSTGLMKRTADALAMDVTGVKQVIDLAGIDK